MNTTANIPPLTLPPFVGHPQAAADGLDLNPPPYASGGAADNLVSFAILCAAFVLVAASAYVAAVIAATLYVLTLSDGMVLIG